MTQTFYSWLMVARTLSSASASVYARAVDRCRQAIGEEAFNNEEAVTLHYASLSEASQRQFKTAWSHYRAWLADEGSDTALVSEVAEGPAAGPSRPPSIPSPSSESATLAFTATSHPWEGTLTSEYLELFQRATSVRMERMRLEADLMLATQRAYLANQLAFERDRAEALDRIETAKKTPGTVANTAHTDTRTIRVMRRIIADTGLDEKTVSVMPLRKLSAPTFDAGLDAYRASLASGDFGSVPIAIPTVVWDTLRPVYEGKQVKSLGALFFCDDRLDEAFEVAEAAAAQRLAQQVAERKRWEKENGWVDGRKPWAQLTDQEKSFYSDRYPNEEKTLDDGSADAAWLLEEAPPAAASTSASWRDVRPAGAPGASEGFIADGDGIRIGRKS